MLKIYSGAKKGECIYGHAYLNNEFSHKLVYYMKEELVDFRISSLFWEEFVGRHLDELDMYTRKFSGNFLYEFDSIQEIQNIESLFLRNVSEIINHKISMVLNCDNKDIHNIEILSKGLTNVLFTFWVKNEKYIFRYPGESSSFFIYRKNEVCAQLLAAKAGVDNTYIYIDESGMKISKYRQECKDLKAIYYEDMKFMKRLAVMVRKFHEMGKSLDNYDIYI